MDREIGARQRADFPRSPYDATGAYYVSGPWLDRPWSDRLERELPEDARGGGLVRRVLLAVVLGSLILACVTVGPPVQQQNTHQSTD